MPGALKRLGELAARIDATDATWDVLVEDGYPERTFMEWCRTEMLLSPDVVPDNHPQITRDIKPRQITHSKIKALDEVFIRLSCDQVKHFDQIFLSHVHAFFENPNVAPYAPKTVAHNSKVEMLECVSSGVSSQPKKM